MNLPNRLSILRVLMIPVCVGLLYVGNAAMDIAALVVFLLACLTDFLDGYIARSRNIVTDFGRFLDPVADKLLVLSMMIMLVSLHRLPAWLVVAVLTRELAVDGLRMVASGKGSVISAGHLGKIKTVSQMLAVAVAVADKRVFPESTFTLALSLIALALTLWSGVDYFIKNRHFLFSSKEPTA